MSNSTDVKALAKLMAGDFSNEAQAIENPPFFAHIRVCMRPLPHSLFGEVSFFPRTSLRFFTLSTLPLKGIYHQSSG